MPIPPRVSVIVPALSEGARINALVDHLRVVGYGTPLEIVIVDGDPDGSTLAALDRTGVLGLTAPRGRARQQNAGAAAASGDILLFLHADTRLPAGAFADVAAALAGRTRAGAFSLSIRSRHPWLRLVAAGANLRSRLFGLPYGDHSDGSDLLSATTNVTCFPKTPPSALTSLSASLIPLAIDCP